MFREVLHNVLNRTEGCLGVLIMGIDGIAVESVWKDGAKQGNLEVALAEFTALMRNADRTKTDSHLGGLREMSIAGDRAIFILRSVTKNYFLAMILLPDGNFGRARYELRCAELLLVNELII
ncbi:MAG TPA: hypothetical protein PKY59_09135 [Pyrinomonadaceae bacterium]|nr:hypothetical protein [Pyrinomonadaceae bacterium]